MADAGQTYSLTARSRPCSKTAPAAVAERHARSGVHRLFLRSPRCAPSFEPWFALATLTRWLGLCNPATGFSSRKQYSVRSHSMLRFLMLLASLGLALLALSASGPARADTLAFDAPTAAAPSF
jgi:hypothetical protein